MSTLEQIIRQHISLGVKNSSGWEPCVHKSCDHGKKGTRAGFLLDKNTITFNCFNCGVSATYNPQQHQSMPDKMAKVLASFDINQQHWQHIIFNNLQTSTTIPNQKTTQRDALTPKNIKLPTSFKYLKDVNNDNKWKIIALDYLQSRCIDSTEYSFILCYTDKKWIGRIIVPIYYNNNLIYWFGRTLINQHKKYLFPPISRNNIIYGFDQLFKQTTHPLLIVEGWFDAFNIGGIAVFGNKLTNQQINWINKSKRPKIVIPDRFGDGQKLATQALNLGWNISIPYDNGWDDKIKDISDCITSYGKMFTIQQILNNIFSVNDKTTALLNLKMRTM